MGNGTLHHPKDCSFSYEDIGTIDILLQTAHGTTAYTKHGNCRFRGEALSLGPSATHNRHTSRAALHTRSEGSITNTVPTYPEK